MGGRPPPEDGNHALYHVETREILQALGLNLVLEDNYEALFEKPDVDFVFPLLNRGGFLNSEMMLPLLCTRLGLPYLGATPDPARPRRRQASDQARRRRARRADRALDDLPPRRAGRAGALPGGRAAGDQAQRLLGELGRAGRARLGRRRGRGRLDPRRGP